MLTGFTSFCRLSAPHLAMAAAVFAAGMASEPTPASAQDFLTGKSIAMKRCVRAILDGYEVRKVKVHGHHFHCKPLGRGTRPNGRSLVLVHDRFGTDDVMHFKYRVDGLNRYVQRSLEVNRSLAALPRVLGMFKPDFNGPFGPPATYEGYRDFALNLRPRKVKNWKTAAFHIHIMVVAELANRRTDTFAPLRARCNRPIFYEHDNYRGEAIRLTASARDLDRVVVNGKKMGNRLSSMCLPAGWRARVYLGRDFQGGNFTFTGPVEISDLQRQKVPGGRRRLNWGDAISSIELTRMRPAVNVNATVNMIRNKGL